MRNAPQCTISVITSFILRGLKYNHSEVCPKWNLSPGSVIFNLTIGMYFLKLQEIDVDAVAREGEVLCMAVSEHVGERWSSFRRRYSGNSTPGSKRGDAAENQTHLLFDWARTGSNGSFQYATHCQGKKITWNLKPSIKLQKK